MKIKVLFQPANKKSKNNCHVAMKNLLIVVYQLKYISKIMDVKKYVNEKEIVVILVKINVQIALKVIKINVLKLFTKISSVVINCNKNV